MPEAYIFQFFRRRYGHVAVQLYTSVLGITSAVSTDGKVEFVNIYFTNCLWTSADDRDLGIRREELTRL